MKYCHSPPPAAFGSAQLPVTEEITKTCALTKNLNYFSNLLSSPMYRNLLSQVCDP